MNWFKQDPYDNIRREIESGSPITPQHERPAHPTDGGFDIDMFRSIENDLFFEDFRNFADDMNEILEFDDGPWRLQEKPSTLIHQFDEPEHGRNYHIYFHKLYIGKMEICHNSFMGYDVSKKHVFLFADIDYAPLLPYAELHHFLTHLSIYCARESDDTRELNVLTSELTLQNALLNNLWESRRLGNFDQPMDIRFVGSAQHYIAISERKRSPRK